VEVGGGGGGGAGYGAGAGGGAGGGGGGSSFLVTGGQLLTNEATNTGDGELLITYDLATDTCVPTTIDVAKTLEGTATGGFTVNVECGTALVATLGFDASGMPTTTSDPVRWAPTGGWWRATLDVTETTECSATETDADGAASTRWTCAWDATFENGQAEDLGCDAADGTGVGPVAFTLGGGGASLLEQEATITFTNSLPESPAESPAESLPEALLLVPRFTG
jgi:hypothetical protein